MTETSMDWFKAREDAERFALYDGLSVRAKHCLYEGDLRTKESIIQAFESGDIKRIRNLGKKTYREILLWLRVQIPKRCPFCGSLEQSWDGTYKAHRT